MTKERIPISGDLKSKVKQLMEYAGWYEGRSVDISIAEQYYANHGVPMMKATQRFYRKYFGLCCQWYLAQKNPNWAADFEFALFPYLINGITATPSGWGYGRALFPCSSRRMMKRCWSVW